MIPLAMVRWVAVFLLSLAPALLLWVPWASARDFLSCGAPKLDCPHVASLLAEREGYGRNATGGLGGEFVVVTSEADSGAGSLRDIVERADRAVWVVFPSDMTIE